MREGRWQFHVKRTDLWFCTTLLPSLQNGGFNDSRVTDVFSKCNRSVLHDPTHMLNAVE